MAYNLFCHNISHVKIAVIGMMNAMHFIIKTHQLALEAAWLQSMQVTCSLAGLRYCPFALFRTHTSPPSSMTQPFPKCCSQTATPQP